MKNFRTYQLAVTFYKEARHLPLAAPLRDQLSRASASIALNLAEGYGRHTPKDQRRFFAIALGSAKECKGVFALESEIIPAALADLLDHVAASTWKLVHRRS